MSTHLRIALAAGLLAAATSLPAAALTVTNSADVTTSTPGAVTFADFDGIADTSIGTVTGGSYNQGRDPGGGGNFDSLTGPGIPIIIQLAHPGSYVGFEWGSMGPFNQVDVYDGYTLLGRFKGYLGAGFLNIQAGAGEAITDVVLTADRCCYAIDNVAAIPAPEPSTCVLMGAGVALLGLRSRRRSRA